METIKIDSELNVNTFEQILIKVVAALEDLTTISICFDMSQLQKMKLGGLTNFITLCGILKENKLNASAHHIKLQVIPPSYKIMSFLHNMQFFKVANNYRWIENIENYAKRDVEAQKKWEGKLAKYKYEKDPDKKAYFKLNYFPIHVIAPSSDRSDFESECNLIINDLIDTIGPALEYDLNFSSKAIKGFWKANYELYKNVYDHSKSWGLLAVQVLEDYVLMSTVDAGIGVKNSMKCILEQKYDKSEISDGLAIKEALLKGCSSSQANDNNKNLGLGLHIVSKYIEKHNGKMFIRSGCCCFDVINNQYKSYDHFPGTQIHLAIPKRSV